MGVAKAKSFLGYMLRYGIYLPQDIDRALPLIKQAAAENDPQAQRLLAHMYEDGVGVERNYEEFLFWLTKAAEQNHPFALFHLGTNYLIGDHVDGSSSFQVESVELLTA